MRSHLIRRIVVLGGLAIAGTACNTDELTFGGPLDLQITSNSPVLVADSLQIDYESVGRSLLGLAVLWGDSQVDSLVFSGAQTAAGRARHRYDTAGVYTIRATLVDQVAGSQAKELTVTINP